MFTTILLGSLLWLTPPLGHMNSATRSKRGESRFYNFQYFLHSPQNTVTRKWRHLVKLCWLFPFPHSLYWLKQFFFYEYFAWDKGRRWHTVRNYNISDFVTALSSPPQSCGAVVVLGAILLSLFILSPIPEEICQIFLAEMKSSGCNTFLLKHQQSETENVLWYAKIYWV